MASIVNRWKSWTPAESTALERTILALIALAPVFYLSIPHWITNISIILVLMILVSSIFSRNYFCVYRDVALLPISFVYIVYFLSIVVSQLGRGVFVSKEYLDQTRWLLGIPIFAFLYYLRIDFARVLGWFSPFIVIFAWISSTFFIPSNAWGERVTIEFMDPLAFGFMSLSVGLMCLITATLELRQRRLSTLAVMNVVGFLIGLYISLRSGSRTGWLAFPFVLLLVARVHFEKSTRGRVYAFLLLVLPLCAIALLSSTVRIRMTEFINEVYSYPWYGGVAPETSVGMRITFYRLGAYYFFESPWIGWGDRGYLAIKDAAEVVRFSTAFTRDFAYNALFHSEWTTQAVRFGVLGLFSVFWVFAVPFYFFLSRLRSHTQAALTGLAFLMCQLIASLSTEIYSSKGMITFSVVVVSGLLASVLIEKSNKNQ